MSASTPSQSPSHRYIQSKGHQRLKRGRRQFQLLIGGSLWRGSPGFQQGYFYVPLASNPNSGRWNRVEPSFTGPLYQHSDSTQHTPSDPSFTDRQIVIDIDDGDWNITRTETDSPTGGTSSSTSPNESTAVIAPIQYESGEVEPVGDTSYIADFPDGLGGNNHFTATLSGAKSFAAVLAEEWALAQTGAPGYGKQSIVMKNFAGQNFGAGAIQIGLLPPSLSDSPFIPFYVAWNSLLLVGDGTNTPTGTFSTSGPLTDEAFYGGPGATLAGNIAGGFIISASFRANNWLGGSLLVDVPYVVGSRFKNIGAAALAVYEDRPGVGTVKVSCVDVDYAGAETLIQPLYTDQKAYSRWQVLFPGRKASSIGGVNERWS